MEKQKSGKKGAMEKQKSGKKAGSSRSLKKEEPAKQRSLVEKELVKELDISMDQAHELMSKSQRKLSIGENQVLTDSEKVRLKAKAKKTHDKEKRKEEEEQRKAEEDAKNFCESCGIRIAKKVGNTRVVIKTENVNYGVCIKCNQDEVPAPVLRAWKEHQAKGPDPKQKGRHSITKEESQRFAKEIEEEDRRKDCEKKGVCPDCFIKTHNVSKFSRQPLKNADVHYGVCIKCNPGGVTPAVHKAWEEVQNNPEGDAPKEANAPRAADKELTKKTSSKRFSAAMIEEDRRKESEKKGECPDCGIKTHKVSWFNREPLKNSNVHYGVCIKCHPDDVPEAVRQEWEKKGGDSEMEVSPSGKNRAAPLVAATSGSDTETPKESTFLSRTFDIPPNVSKWLEENLSRDDVSVVVMAGASGKSLRTYMKDKSERKSRRRSSSHRRDSDMAPEEVAALRKEMKEMKKEMHDILLHVETATEAETDH